MITQNSDFIIIGGGTIGLASSFSAATRGFKTTLVEQHKVYNKQNSSRGVDRLFHISYAEPRKVYLAQQALIKWRELEKLANKKILHHSELLYLGYAKGTNILANSLQSIKQCLENLQIPHNYFNSPQEIASAFPIFDAKKLPSDFIALSQNTSATIDVSNSFASLKQEGLKTQNLQILEQTKVLAVEKIGGKWSIYTQKQGQVAEKIYSKYLVICAGMWQDELLKFFGLRSKQWEIWNMTYSYHKILDKNIEVPTWYEFGNTQKIDKKIFYTISNLAFNKNLEGTVKIASDCSYDKLQSPNQAKMDIFNKTIVKNVKNYLASRLQDGILDFSATSSYSCPYTISPDLDMIIGGIPEKPESSKYIANVSFFCDSFGRSFKFTPLFGSILVDLALNGTTIYNEQIKDSCGSRAGILAQI